MSSFRAVSVSRMGIAPPTAIVVVIMTSLAFACSSGGGSSSGENPPPPNDFDAGPISGTATTITITTLVPGSSATPGGQTNATWAAFRKDDGSWSALSPTPLTAAGSYVFETRTPRWAVAFACADDQSSLVAIHEDATSVTKANVVLESSCGPPQPELFTIAGTISNVSATTSWLDFGYPLESRGVTLPLSGTSATYEEVNVISGTWDLAFGLRDNPGLPLTKIAIFRAHTLSADETLNIDLGGALSFAPGSSKLAIRGIDPAETIAAPVRYTTGATGEQGIDLGPQDIPSGANLDLAYGTVPPNAQVATDHYRAAVTVVIEDEARRGVTASFHNAIDLDLTLPPPLEGVGTAIASTTPYIRVTTNVPITRANVSSIESSVLARISNKSHRVWRMTIGAAALAGTANVPLVMPDLAAVAGFDSVWTLPANTDKSVTATVYEAPTPLGDGTVTRFSARTVFIPR